MERGTKEAFSEEQWEEVTNELVNDFVSYFPEEWEIEKLNSSQAGMSNSYTNLYGATGRMQADFSIKKEYLLTVKLHGLTHVSVIVSLGDNSQKGYSTGQPVKNQESYRISAKYEFTSIKDLVGAVLNHVACCRYLEVN